MKNKSKNTLRNFSIVAFLCIITLMSACTKNPDGTITVTTKTVTDITESSAKTGGSVTSSGYSIGDCGVCYGESHNPTLNNSFTKDHEGDGSFNSTLSNLKSGTQYYVRAYAKTSSGIEYGDEMSFTTQGGYTINVFTNPTAGGTVTGAGNYQSGKSCTVTATANTGYTFTNWKENGAEVSSDENYTFTVTGNRNLTANFSLISYSVTASVAPDNSGTVSGGGEYNHGQSCTLRATANAGFSFTNWTENGEVVSTNANYTFSVTDNRTLVANFTILTYTVSVSANPSNGGSVSGGGTFPASSTATLTATANPDYAFTKWTENGYTVSTDANYTFTVTSNRTLVANFAMSTALPTVTTNNVTNITHATATCGGNVTYDGGLTITERGLCWSTSPNPTIETGSSVVLGSGTGSFTGQITGLNPNTNYYVKAFATNSAGTSYGNEKSFTTTTTTSEAWLYYDNDDGESWGYTDGGTLVWAVMFPSDVLEQYIGMKITKIKAYLGTAGSYDIRFYTGSNIPTTEIFSANASIDHPSWWNILLYESVSINGQNLWISLSTTHAAGEYPAGASAGSNNPNARWINWGTNGWCDAYLSGWANQDLTWNIRAYVTNNDKSYEIGLNPYHTQTYKCEPKKIHTSQSVGNKKSKR